MQSLIAAAEKNDIGLPKEAIEDLKLEIQKGAIGHVCPDKEAVPFMLYCIGTSFEDIAVRTNIHIKILWATALYYNWPEKRRKIQGEKDFQPEAVLSDVFNLSLVIIQHGIKDMAKDVLSGKRRASQFPLFPKNLHGFEKLLLTLEKMKQITGDLPPTVGNNSGTVVQANNVQINQHQNPQDLAEYTDEEIEARKKERAEKYKAIKGG